MKLSPGICDVKMYDKRDSMPALASYRNFPHIETTVSTSRKYAVFHSQLCRFAYRCTRRNNFVDAASRLLRDMWLHGYDLKSLRRKLYNFRLRLGEHLEYFSLLLVKRLVEYFGINWY